MDKLNFVQILHCHQPVGNFDFVLEQATDRCYLPFLKVYERYPRLGFGLHVSGPLIDYWVDKRGELIELIAAMVERGQLEMLGGAYEESILSLWPRRDNLGQLKRMADKLEALFGRRPRGIWLAERVWSPELPDLLAEAGVEYTVVDDTHIRFAGVLDETIGGVYGAEHLGRRVALLPSDKGARYRIPFRLATDIVEYLRECHEGGLRVLTYGDDGEKFGLWPKTHKWVFEEGWLQSYCEALTDPALDWLACVQPSEAVAAAGKQPLVYIPNASYHELLTWALPAPAAELLEDAQKRAAELLPRGQADSFVRGGFWNGFLAKYEESNHIHKRVLDLSRRLATVESAGVLSAEFSTARRALERAQCNCAYWHGLFGGLYLGHLRDALYRNLLAAEASILAAERAAGTTEVVRTRDFLAAGAEQQLISAPEYTALVEPGAGAALTEFSLRLAGGEFFSLSNTLTRRREHYHTALLNPPEHEPDADQPASPHDAVTVKEGLDAEKLPAFDLVRRAAARVRLLDAGEAFVSGDGFAEIGRALGRYAAPQVEAGRERVRLRFAATDDGPAISYDFRLDAPAFTIECDCADGPAGTALEFNFNLLAGDAHDRYYLLAGEGMDAARRLSKPMAACPACAIELTDEYEGIRVTITPVAGASLMLVYPVFTASQSESGVERTFQGNCVMFSAAADAKTLTCEVSVTALQ